jgi:hypothetical protein
MPGTSPIHFATMIGAVAYPTTVIAICPTAMRSDPATSKPTSVATPPMPTRMPTQLVPVNRSERRSTTAAPTLTRGTAASSSPAVELGSRCSAVVRKNQGSTSSMSE